VELERQGARLGVFRQDNLLAPPKLEPWRWNTNWPRPLGLRPSAQAIFSGNSEFGALAGPGGQGPATRVLFSPGWRGRAGETGHTGQRRSASGQGRPGPAALTSLAATARRTRGSSGPGKYAEAGCSATSASETARPNFFATWKTSARTALAYIFRAMTATARVCGCPFRTTTAPWRRRSRLVIKGRRRARSYARRG
jgi:hypothetical protein